MQLLDASRHGESTLQKFVFQRKVMHESASTGTKLIKTSCIMLYFVNIFRLRCAFATALSADLLPTSNPTNFPELRRL